MNAPIETIIQFGKNTFKNWLKGMWTKSRKKFKSRSLSKGKQHLMWLVSGCLLLWGMQCPICLLLWQQKSVALLVWGIRGYASGLTSNRIIRCAKSWTQSYLQNLCKKIIQILLTMHALGKPSIIATDGSWKIWVKI